jgi:hypothetical protein
MGFWLERLVARTRIPFPIFFTAVNVALYLGGLALAAATGNTGAYLSQPRWALMAAFGALNGSAIFITVRYFRKSLGSIRPLMTVGDDEWGALQERLVGQVTSPIYWVLVVFWLAFSFYSEFVRGSGWFSIGVAYSRPELMAVYAYLYQGFSGCLLGGMLMGMLPVNLSLAFWRLVSKGAFSDEIITARGKAFFGGIKNLIIVDTGLLVVSTGIAMSLWMEVVPLAPVVGSLAEFIPTAVIPHVLFHVSLAGAKERRLDGLGLRAESLLGNASEASLGDIIRFQGLLRDEDRVSGESTWLVDLGAVIELVAVTFVHLLITQGLAILLNI